MIYDKFNENGLVVNEHYFNRYMKLVRIAKNRKLENVDYIEKHHILPKSLFPDNIKDKWNLIELTLREHWIAHYLLAKATDHRFMWFALHFMTEVGSRHYSMVRKIRLEKIIENNGIRGKKPYTNIKTGKTRYFVDNPGAEWGIGLSGSVREKMSETHSQNLWYHDPLTLKNCRIKYGQEIPSNLVRGRAPWNNAGFDKVNSDKIVPAYCIKTREHFTMELDKINSSDTFIPLPLGKKDKIYFFVYNNLLFYSFDKFQRYMCQLNFPWLKVKLENLDNYRIQRIKKGPASKDTKLFCIENEGKSLREVGIFYYKMEDYVYDENHVIYRN